VTVGGQWERGRKGGDFKALGKEEERDRTAYSRARKGMLGEQTGTEREGGGEGKEGEEEKGSSMSGSEGEKGKGIEFRSSFCDGKGIRLQREKEGGSPSLVPEGEGEGAWLSEGQAFTREVKGKTS